MPRIRYQVKCNDAMKRRQCPGVWQRQDLPACHLCLLHHSAHCSPSRTLQRPHHTCSAPSTLNPFFNPPATNNAAPALLPLRVAHAQQVAHEGSAPLGVGELVGVNVADAADDGLVQLVTAEVKPTQEVDGACRCVCVGGGNRFACGLRMGPRALGLGAEQGLWGELERLRG